MLCLEPLTGRNQPVCKAAFFSPGSRNEFASSPFRLLAKFSSLQLGESGPCFITGSQQPGLAAGGCPHSSSYFTCGLPSHSKAPSHTRNLTFSVCLSLFCHRTQIWSLALIPARETSLLSRTQVFRLVPR